MTNESKFLETEAVVNALMDELDKLKSAAQQLDQARTAAQDLTDMSQNLVNWAAELLERSSSQLEATQAVGDQVSQALEQFKSSQGEATKRLGVLEGKQELLQASLGGLKTGLDETQNSQKSAFLNQGELIRQQGAQFQAGLKQGSERLEQIWNKQQVLFQAQSDLEEKNMAILISLKQSVRKSAKTFNILLVISILNTLLGIALLVLRIT